jgi:hypothetical protein
MVDLELSIAAVGSMMAKLDGGYQAASHKQSKFTMLANSKIEN